RRGARRPRARRDRPRAPARRPRPRRRDPDRLPDRRRRRLRRDLVVAEAGRPRVRDLRAVGRGRGVRVALGAGHPRDGRARTRASGDRVRDPVLGVTETDNSGLTLAEHFLHMGRPDAALEALERVGGAAAENADAWRLRAWALADLERHREALDAAKSGLRIEPDDTYLL